MLLHLFCTVNVQSAMRLMGGEEGGKNKFHTGKQKISNRPRTCNSSSDQK